MKIVLISQFYSPEMGYTENILPKYLSKLGHEVIVISSDLQVYGNSKDYEQNYGAFLGDAKCPVGQFHQDGFMLYRLPHFSISGYIVLKGLSSLLRRLQPDILQFIQVAGVNNFITLINPFAQKYPTFTECHQHASIAKDISSRRNLSHYIKHLTYKLTRTFPSYLAHKNVEKCFSVSPDCQEVAKTLYGVPINKTVILPLGTDTDLFHPCETIDENEERENIRSSFGINNEDIMVVYTGRFSKKKNPLILAKAIEILRSQGNRFIGVFVGAGVQKTAIISCAGCSSIDFQRHSRLAVLYRSADIAVWPREESMSMLDAASSGLALIVSNEMGEQDRIMGNGLTYDEGSVNSLVKALSNMINKTDRVKLGEIGRKKMIQSYSWSNHVGDRLKYYEATLNSFK